MKNSNGTLKVEHKIVYKQATLQNLLDNRVARSTTSIKSTDGEEHETQPLTSSAPLKADDI